MEGETDRFSADFSILQASSALLSALDLKETDFLKHSFRAGRYVTDRLYGVPSVGVLASGSLGVYAAALDGNDVELTRLYTGDCFGICNLMRQEEMETVLCCMEDTSILYIAKSLLLSRMEEDPRRALRCMALCTEKLHFLLRRISQLTIQSSRAKLISYVLTESNGAECLELPGSREDLARRLGISRAALFRELAFLQEKELLRSQAAKLYILDRSALEMLIYRSD